MMKKLLLAILLISYCLNAQIIYVDQNATGLNNGTDWANAYTDLQYAITNIGGNTTINVAQGTYKPTTTADRTIYFNIPRDKKLFGGFPTGGGTRNPDLNPTILSGDIGIIGVNTDNSYHVVYCNNTSRYNEFDGFIIEKGYADGSGSNENNGGGILISTIDTGSYGVYIRNCIVRNNYAAGSGGGIAAGKQFQIYNCKIYSNHADSYGGGLSLSTSGNIYNSLIVNNSAIGNGGGIYLTGSIGDPKAINCIIANNQSVNGAGGAYITMGAIVNCTAVNNKGDYGVFGRSANSIIWGNEITINQIKTPTQFATTILQNNIVQDFTPFGTNINLSDANNGNVFGENYPRFSNPISFKGNATTPAELEEIFNADWSINPQSAAIDFGNNDLYPTTTNTPTVDIIGNNRTINTTMDAGAHEALINIITTQATNQETTSAALNGEILFAETLNTIERGFIYDPSENFEITFATSITNSSLGIGVYSNKLASLTENQFYYYRAWAELDGVKYYGNEMKFNTSNLVAYYPFNGNANDESGNENHGTVNGATLVADRIGDIDNAYNFDGINDFILCNTQVGPFGTDSRTVSFLAKTDVEPDSNTQQNSVLSYGQWPTGGGRFEVLLNPKCRGLGVDVSSNYITRSFDNSDNDWHFYTVVFDNTISNFISSLKFYGDGVLLTNVCNTNGNISINTLNDNQVLNIGRLFYSGQPRYFKGTIDEIRIYNKALTTTEILELYESEIALSVEKFDNVTESNFYVYNNTLYFKNIQDITKIKNIEVYNMLGQKVFKTSKIDNEVSLRTLPIGIYVLKVKNNIGDCQTLKIIIN